MHPTPRSHGDDEVRTMLALVGSGSKVTTLAHSHSTQHRNLTFQTSEWPLTQTFQKVSAFDTFWISLNYFYSKAVLFLILLTQSNSFYTQNLSAFWQFWHMTPHFILKPGSLFSNFSSPLTLCFQTGSGIKGFFESTPLMDPDCLTLSDPHVN